MNNLKSGVRTLCASVCFLATQVSGKVPLEPLSDVVRRSDLIVVGDVGLSRPTEGEYDEVEVKVLSTIRGATASSLQISAMRDRSIEPHFKYGARCVFLLRSSQGRVIATAGYASVVCDLSGSADFAYFADVASGTSFNTFVDRIRQLALATK